MSYSPEIGIAELRNARDSDPVAAELAAIMARAAQRATDELWSNPRERELAGIGCVVACATLGGHADSPDAHTLMSSVGFFGLALVESARSQMGESR